ncbi:GNAT family N-acetyltransferase [Halobacillus litoralis]|uniref:GNAT family N-acetyltransferase n=1 Tax=Halobacillus litoralis TaxID=45668 RepID=UPI001CD36598|nr:GNAT family N-acetyltransferase [Halobacillus litoralis]MCA0970199.1 GNAT family N-acetyltransferase [Halobacillus litoralis]
MPCKLVAPSMEWKDAYLDFYREWKHSGETMVPWVIEKDPKDFEEMIQYLENHAEGLHLPEGFVPDSTYWFVNPSDNIVGAVNIRHDLTEALRNGGGHIGYGIRPTERRKGYATELLRQSVQKACEIGIKQVLVVCDETNLGSMKTILNNGGIIDHDFIEEDGNVVKRFWIAT